MWAAVAFVYWRPLVPGGSVLASDYNDLHRYRMSFARQAISAGGVLPGWYPRELLGTPFWSNIQSFPFLPTRLMILLLDPNGPYTYTLGITTAALLAATFAFLFARKIGLGATGSAVAGWTFVACGYFSSRVAAGHLPFLEVYGALPLILWCAECGASAQEKDQPIARWLVALSASSFLIMLGGHPQLPVYALIVGAIYLLWRIGFKKVWPWALAMGLGVGCASFALYPMLLLIGRSTRVLDLEAATNDLAMPYGRYLGFFLPWIHGAAPPLPWAKLHPFAYPTYEIFWDTFDYAGWMPWIAAILLLGLLIRRRVRLDGKSGFVLAMGIAGLILSLPLTQQVLSIIPGTLLRSPARWIYITELSLALGLGAAIGWIISSMRIENKWIAPFCVTILLLIHGFDLAGTAGEFDRRFGPDAIELLNQSLEPALARVGDGRIAMDAQFELRANRQYDDAGFFDSIMLARPYSLMMDLSDAPKNRNIQQVDGSSYSVRALEAAGVKLVFSMQPLTGMRVIGESAALHCYATPAPARRAEFFPLSNVRIAPDNQVRDILRDERFDVSQLLLIPQSVASPFPGADISPAAGEVTYQRPGPDVIQCDVSTSRYGYLRVIESWDPGWSATVDGVVAAPIPAMGALLALPLAPGKHSVTFTFRTPGATTGIFLSLICLAGVVVMTVVARKAKPAHTPAT